VSDVRIVQIIKRESDDMLLALDDEGRTWQWVNRSSGESAWVEWTPTVVSADSDEYERWRHLMYVNGYAAEP
jgi:hypothetical protein